MKTTLMIECAAALLLAVAPLSRAAEAPGGRGLLTITTYGTGEEGHLITFPDSSTLSIDCARGGITTTSHLHSDHCASCDSTGDFYRNNVVPGQYLYNKDGVTVQVVAANGRIIGEDAEFVSCPASDENGKSMGLLVSYGGFDYLTAGDLTSSVEDRMGPALAERGVNVDILKVSHHGSKSGTSQEYVQSIQPEYAVVAGNASSPYEETLMHLTDAGVKTIYYAQDYSAGDGYPVFRANGNIVIATDGNTFTFSGNGFSHGPFPTDVGGPAPTPAPDPGPDPAPEPTPVTPPLVHIAAAPSVASAGKRIAVDVSVGQIMDRPFDAYAVILGPPGVFSIRFGNSLVPGVSPIARRVLFLSGGYDGTLLDMEVPTGVPGDYQAIVGLADAGAPVTGVGSAFAWGVAYFSVR